MLSLSSHKLGAREKDERLLISSHMQAVYSACAHGVSALQWRSCPSVRDVTVPQRASQSPGNSLWEETAHISFSAQPPIRHLTTSKLFNLVEHGFCRLGKVILIVQTLQGC